MVLFPEGAIRLQGTGLHILQLCDGNRTSREIIEELQANYSLAERDEEIRDRRCTIPGAVAGKGRIVDF